MALSSPGSSQSIVYYIVTDARTDTHQDTHIHSPIEKSFLVLKHSYFSSIVAWLSSQNKTKANVNMPWSNALENEVGFDLDPGIWPPGFGRSWKKTNSELYVFFSFVCMSSLFGITECVLESVISIFPILFTTQIPLIGMQNSYSVRFKSNDPDDIVATRG